MTTCPQPKFAHVIENLNRELRQKGPMIIGVASLYSTDTILLSLISA